MCISYPKCIILVIVTLGGPRLNYLQAFGLNLEADLQAFGLNFDTHKCINQITEKELHFWQAVVTFLLYNRK